MDIKNNILNINKANLDVSCKVAKTEQKIKASGGRVHRWLFVLSKNTIIIKNRGNYDAKQYKYFNKSRWRSE